MTAPRHGRSASATRPDDLIVGTGCSVHGFDDCRQGSSTPGIARSHQIERNDELPLHADYFGVVFGAGVVEVLSGIGATGPEGVRSDTTVASMAMMASTTTAPMMGPV